MNGIWRWCLLRRGISGTRKNLKHRLFYGKVESGKPFSIFFVQGKAPLNRFFIAIGREKPFNLSKKTEIRFSSGNDTGKTGQGIVLGLYFFIY
jgi:hypothetical protein